MDYGDGGVDIHQVLMPLDTDWTIPSGFQCSDRCVNMTPWTATHLIPNFNGGPLSTGKRLGKRLVVVPYYRFAYINSPYVYPTIYHDLEQELPGFDLENGMACSFGSLLDLSPSASQFEPDLFTRILPTLRDESALVMTIYIRSGHTDRAAKAEKGGKVAKQMTDTYRRWAMPCLQCALNIEERYLSKDEGLTFSRIIWMVVTDSTYLKQWITESYGSQDANERVVPDKRKWTNRVIPREIVTTTSRGVQTRTARNPSTVDFAEALIDWYLIGESDLVVTSNQAYTFAATASLRTTRPFYDAANCFEIPRFGPPRFNSELEASQPRILNKTFQ
jgi:hypothetical protein